MQFAALPSFQVFQSSAVLPLADIGLLFVFLLAAGVTAMAGVGFVFWISYQIVRLIALLVMKLFMLPVGVGRSGVVAAEPTHQACADPVCRTVNPEHARFCRQCGRMLRHLRIAA